MNIIKKILLLVILIVSLLASCYFGCKTNDCKKMEYFKTVTDIFDQSEIEDLITILDFFNSQICAIEEVEEYNITNYYNQYDVRDPRIRLVVAIHYLTLNDQFERKDKY